MFINPEFIENIEFTNIELFGNFIKIRFSFQETFAILEKEIENLEFKNDLAL